jgi:hypothetical protein
MSLTYDLPDATGVDLEQLGEELNAAGIIHRGLSVHQGKLSVLVEAAVDAAAVDAVVEAHVPRTELDIAKRRAIEFVYRGLNRRLAETVTVEYPAGSGKYWPVCDRGHRHWRAARAQADSIVPLTARTKDGLDEHTFTEPAEIVELADLIDSEVLAQQRQAEEAIAEILRKLKIHTVKQVLEDYIGG